MDDPKSETLNGGEGGRPLLPGLHSTIYKALIGCALAMGIGAWLFSGGKGTYSLAFAMVGIFAVIAAIIPSVLSRFARRRAAPRDESLRDWSHGDLDVYGHDPIRAPSAALMILIAPLAGAVGLIVLAIVARLATGGAI